MTASGSSAVPISTSKNFMPDLPATSYDPPVGASLLPTFQTYQPRTKCTRLQRLWISCPDHDACSCILKSWTKVSTRRRVLSMFTRLWKIGNTTLVDRQFVG